MIDQTESFKKLKIEQQKILDFTVLICYSIPNFKKAIKGFKNQIPNYETLSKPDYFKDVTNIPQLESIAKDYKENLSKYTLISAFSFFESYFRDVITELVEFHGGKENFIENVHLRHKAIIATVNTTIEESKKKLNEPLKKKNYGRYKKHIDILNTESQFRYPSELLATFGLKYFIEIVGGSNFKSVMIPDILEYAFGLDLLEKVNKHKDLKEKNLKETFDTMRNIRNSIGHGSSTVIGFEKVMDLIRFLRYFAVKIDNHLVNHFFILERAK